MRDLVVTCDICERRVPPGFSNDYPEMGKFGASFWQDMDQRVEEIFFITDCCIDCKKKLQDGLHLVRTGILEAKKIKERMDGVD